MSSTSKSSQRSPREVAAECHSRLELVIETMNEAQEQGLRIEFRLGLNEQGKNAIVLFDAFEKLKLD